MRSPTFFKERASNSFLKIIQISENYIHEDMLDQYIERERESKEFKEAKSKYDQQTKELIDLEFRIRMMLSEFDNGESFINRYNPERKSFDKLYYSIYTSKDELYKHGLKQLNETIALFVEHLNEYRL